MRRRPKSRIAQWLEEQRQLKEESVNAPKVNPIRLPREVFWRSRSGKWVVVAGPFPVAMARSETRDHPDKAAKALVDGIYIRPPTTRDDQYAKVAAKDIIEINKGSNEFGPVTP